jgi:hypothetical protein
MKTSGKGTKIKKHKVINSQTGRNKGKIRKMADNPVLQTPSRVSKVS